MKLLIVYGTTEGQTRKIAEFLKSEAQKLNCSITLAEATGNPPDPKDFDAVLIASSMHIQRYQTSIEHYVRKYKKELNNVHSAFLSVSLTAASDEEESWKELKKLTQEFFSHTGWKPRMVEYVAGALRFTEYDFMKKFIMRLIAKKAGRTTDTSHDTEYTDWNSLHAFLNKFMDGWAPAPITVQADVSDKEAVG